MSDITVDDFRSQDPHSQASIEPYERGLLEVPFPLAAYVNVEVSMDSFSQTEGEVSQIFTSRRLMSFLTFHISRFFSASFA